MDPHGPPASAEADGPDQLDALRRLLLAPEQHRIEELDRRLEDREIRTADVAQVLPEAVRRSASDGPDLGRSLAPLIDAGLREAVRRDPKLIVDVVYPVLGPIIRKSVANSIRGTIESLNRVVEHSFTWRGLKWRIEAMRTGESVAEVALRHSLIYRVEQVFLIHRETGLPLETVAISEEARDEELVTGMLTAIQDFVRDSFSVEQSQELDRLEVGDFQVWIERGPRAVLAAVIRGSAPRRLRTKLADALGSIHAAFGDRLASFDGDAAPFESARPDLEDCLDQETQAPRKGVSPLLLAIAALLPIALGTWLFSDYQERRRWREFVSSLGAEPGLVLVEQGTRDGRRFVSVMQDPLARDAGEILAASEVEPPGVTIQSRPYLSLDPALVATRARQVFASVQSAVEAVEIEFEAGSATIGSDQGSKLLRLAAALAEAQRSRHQSGIEWTAVLLGGADSTGAAETNDQLRASRAAAVRDQLIELGAPADRLRTRPAADSSRAVRVELVWEKAP